MKLSDLKLKNSREVKIFFAGMWACALGHIIASLLNMIKYTI